MFMSEGYGELSLPLADCSTQTVCPNGIDKGELALKDMNAGELSPQLSDAGELAHVVWCD